MRAESLQGRRSSMGQRERLDQVCRARRQEDGLHLGGPESGILRSCGQTRRDEGVGSRCACTRRKVLYMDAPFPRQTQRLNAMPIAREVTVFPKWVRDVVNSNLDLAQRFT